MEQEHAANIEDSLGEDRDGSMPIVRKTLHSELLERLRQMIIDGDLSPGSKVPEKSLCDRFAVSRTPLREALKVLASEGLVTLTPNRGAMVSDLTFDDLEDVFPIMGALEALAGEMACAHISDEEIAEIRVLHHQMVAHFEARDRSEYFSVNQKIHERILDAARNQTLATLYRGLSGRVKRARYLANMSIARWTEAVEEHEFILKALEERDGSELARILKHHLARKFEIVKDGLTNSHG